VLALWERVWDINLTYSDEWYIIVMKLKKVLEKWVKRHSWRLHPDEMSAFIEDISEAGWISVEDELPNKDTRYAKRFGVGVLIFDKLEECGATPFHASFNFEKQQFRTTASGPSGTVWLPISVTHWQPYPMTHFLLT
jgi:hypothetical protein